MATQGVKQNDGLFLLEVLIDKIVFAKSPCYSDKDFRTCVLIECPTVDPLEICDDEPGACSAKNYSPFVKNFNNGKSCLFSLKESDISQAMSKFPIKVTVYKSLPCGCLPTRIVIGEATIDMTKEFVEARKKFLEDSNNVSYQALKDSFRLVGQDTTETGEIVMFLRISSFGKHITTRFQGAGGLSTLGAGGGTSNVDRTSHLKKEFQSTQDPCSACGASKVPESGSMGAYSMGSYSTYHATATQNSVPKSDGSASAARKQLSNQKLQQRKELCHTTENPRAGALGLKCGNPYGSCPIAKDIYNSMPCQELEDSCYCSGPRPTKMQQMACRNTDPYCLHIPKGRSKEYEEIGTTLAGNELKIKVPASASVIKKISQTHVAMQCPFTKRTEDGPCAPPCGKNQISLALPSEATCCRGAQLAATQFSCTTEGCTQVSKHGQQTALARGDLKAQDVVNKDSFVLKVAKTALEGDRKCRLEMELVTPKGPDKIPPVQKANMRIQSDPNCECCGERRVKRHKDCCPTGNKVIFQMPSDTCGMAHKQRAHFNFTSDGIGDVARDEPSQLLQPTAENYTGVVYDFPKKVIKLRIGKTVELPGILLRLPIVQVLTEEQKRNLKSGRNGGGDTSRQKKMMNIIHNSRTAIPSYQATQIVNECLHIFIENLKFPPKSISESESISDCRSGTSSLFGLKYKKRSVSFCDTVDCVSRSQSHSTVGSSEECAPNCFFGVKETAVYMTLCDDFCHQKCSGTQATAYINKCLQVSDKYKDTTSKFKNLHKNSNYSSSISSVSRSKREASPSSTRYSDVYFFGRKNKRQPDSGMGHTDKKSSNSNTANTHSEQLENYENDLIKNRRGMSKATSTAKAVCIKEENVHNPDNGRESTDSDKKRKNNGEDKKGTNATSAKKRTSGGMIATVSHIRIGPQCPVHGGHRCPSGGQGMKCIVASSENGQDAPVKVSTVTNSRRGVFELVIRRMTGAPLAKNELMLEWTPPPSKTCGLPCPIPVLVPPCHHSKCKMIICRPSPCRSPCRVKSSKSKCCKRSKPCGPIPCPVPCSPVPYGIPCRSSSCRSPPCRSPPCQNSPCGPVQCRKCSKPSCSGKPCRSCTPCTPCVPQPCGQPYIPCKSSPCLSLCPVGRRKPRRCHSQPRIKAHRKRISPCCNRKKFCPVVRCQSVPSPCNNCGGFSCPPRKCRSIFPFKPKCCRSTCSTCCV